MVARPELVLRDYQTQAVQSVLTYFNTHRTGRPLVCIPTGGGKSLVMAATMKEVCRINGPQNFLLLQHNKELVRQNEQEIHRYWPGVHTSVYSAGLGRREHRGQVRLATVQSVWRKPGLFRDVQAVIVDEAHTVSARADSMYWQILERLGKPVIGYTATPYRLTSGMLYDGVGATFTDLVHDTGMLDLMDEGHLSPLQSIVSAESTSMVGVRKQSGEYVASAAGDAMARNADRAVDDYDRKTRDRRKGLVFCCTIKHAQEVAARLPNAAAVHSKMSKEKREANLEDFRAGRIKHLCNVNILTTGFNVPDVDCIGLMRPTTSPGLYVQMVGRGTRNAPGKESCLVLDYAGNIERLGPVTNPDIPGDRKPKKTDTDPPPPVLLPCTKCEAHTLVRTGQTAVCWKCGAELGGHPVDVERAGIEAARNAPAIQPESATADIMGRKSAVPVVEVMSSTWNLKTNPGKPTFLSIRYMCKDQDGQTLAVFDNVCPEHGGFAERTAERWAYEHKIDAAFDAAGLMAQKPRALRPTSLRVTKSGKFWSIQKRYYK